MGQMLSDVNGVPATHFLKYMSDMLSGEKHAYLTAVLPIHLYTEHATLSCLVNGAASGHKNIKHTRSAAHHRIQSAPLIAIIDKNPFHSVLRSASSDTHTKVERIIYHPAHNFYLYQI